jgi:hypothetical protein
MSRLLGALLAVVIGLLPICANAQTQPPSWPANTAGGGCAGIVTGVGTIPSATFTQNTTGANATLLAGVASKINHVCALTIGGVTTVAGTLTLVTGTNANCAAGTVTLRTYQIGVNASGVPFDTEVSATDLLAVPTGNFLCIASTATGTITVNGLSATY